MECQSSIEDIDEITKQISVSVPSARVSKEFEASVTQASRSARVNGFRPGKVPRKMVEKMLGDRIRFEVAQKLIQESLKDVYETHKLDVVGDPEVDLQSIEPTQALEFKAKVSLFPQPVISNFKGRSVEVTKRLVADADVEQAVEKQVEAKAELKAVEDRKVSEKGDVVALSVSVRVEDDEFSRPEPFVDVLGGGKLNPAIEEQLVGMTVGDNKSASMIAPEDHANADLRGKTLTYQATLHGIFSKKLPELTDEFVKSLGQGVDSVAALKESIRTQLAKQAADESNNDVQGAILDVLVAENPFKIPQIMIDEEIRGIVSRYGFGGARDADPATINVEMFRPQFEDFALNRIRCAIIIDKIGEAEGIKVEESDREQFIQRVAEKNGSSIEETKKNLLDKSRIVSFLLEVRRTKILEFLVSNTTVSFKEPGEEASAAA
jgi:trigger factor